jgi:hypothetical protein
VNSARCLYDKARIAREILAYLADHPEAEDTLEGIVQWWLLERRIVYQAHEVKAALDHLVRKGVLLEQRQGDANTLYRVNRGKNGSD